MPGTQQGLKRRLCVALVVAAAASSAGVLTACAPEEDATLNPQPLPPLNPQPLPPSGPGGGTTNPPDPVGEPRGGESDSSGAASSSSSGGTFGGGSSGSAPATAPDAGPSPCASGVPCTSTYGLIIKDRKER